MNKVQKKSGYKMKLQIFLLFTCTLFFLGCSPKYVMKYEYIPSNDENFSICSTQCETKRNSCQIAFEARQQDCVNEAKKRAEDIYRVELAQYQDKYTAYQQTYQIYYDKKRQIQRQRDIAYRDYQYFSHKCTQEHDKYACRRATDLKYELKHLEKIKFSQPLEPTKPLLAQIYNQEASFCQKTNECNSDYDKCYTSCGGKIIPHRICIENCE